MHSYPAWKIWLVTIVMLVALVLALPNVFGEGPALQLSRNDRAAFTDQSQAAVTAILAAKSVPCRRRLPRGRPAGPALRQRRTSSSRPATRSAQAAPRDYLIALSQVPRTPAWMRAVGLKPMSLGLDLRGGVYFMYEVDVKGAVKQLLESMERDYRTHAARRAHPVQRHAERRHGHGEDPAALGRRRAARRVAAAQARPEPGHRDRHARRGRFGQRDACGRSSIKERQDFAIQQNITTLRNRVDELGVTEPIVARQGLDRIVVQLPGVQDPNEALRVLGATATLEFRLVDDQNSPPRRERTKRAPLGSKLYHTREDQPVLLKRDIIVSGEQLVDASSGFSRGPAGRVRQARRARRRGDAAHDAREPRPPDGGGVHREEARQEGEPCNGAALGRGVHRGAGHQRRDHPRRVQQQLPDHRAARRRGARARAAAARRVARRAALHRRAAHRRPEPRPGQHRPRRARARSSACSRCSCSWRCTTGPSA